MSLLVNMNEMLQEFQFRQQWAAEEVERRQVRLNALSPNASERDRLHREIAA